VARAFFLHYRWEISEDFSGEYKIWVVTCFRSGTDFLSIQVRKHRIDTG
jgi:hypothetical protein